MLKSNDSNTNLIINENFKLITTLKTPIKNETPPSPKKNSNEHLAKASKLSDVVGFLAEKWLTTNKLQQKNENLSATNYLNKNFVDNNKDHDEILASTSIKSIDNDNANKNTILNTDSDYSIQQFINIFNNKNLSNEDTEEKTYSKSDNVFIEKNNKSDSESEESIQIDTTQNKIDCGTSCCSQSSTNSFVSTIIAASTGQSTLQKETASTATSEMIRLVSLSPEINDLQQDLYLNNSECKQDSTNFNNVLPKNNDPLTVKMEENLELNNRIISEFYDSATKRRKIQMPQKTQHLNDTLEKTNINQTLNNKTSETLNTQFDELDISNQNFSSIFETFNQFFLNSLNELEKLNNFHQINGSTNLKNNTLLSLFNNDPANVLALFNSTINNASTNNDFLTVPILNSNSEIIDTIEQTKNDNSNSTDLLNLYNSILQLTGCSTENSNISEFKVNDQSLITKALNQFNNIKNSTYSLENQHLQPQLQQSDQQQQQILPTFDPLVLFNSEFVSVLLAMSSQNFNNNKEDNEKNLCKENFSTIKNKKNFVTEKAKQLFEKEKNCNFEDLTSDSKNNLNFLNTTTSSSDFNNSTNNSTSVIVNNSSVLTCSPSSSTLSSPNSTSASSFSSSNNLTTNINNSLNSFNTNNSTEKTQINSPCENVELVVTTVLEALINPSTAPAALSMISNNKNIQNLLIDYFANCNNTNSFDASSVSPNFDTDLSTQNVTEDMLKNALQKALKSALKNENEKSTVNSDIASLSWLASSLNSTSTNSNFKTNTYLNKEIKNDNIDSPKFLPNDEYNRQNENLPLSFTKNKLMTITPTVASVLEERRQKRPRTTSKSSYSGTGSSVLVASSAIKNVSNALQAANLTGPTTVSAVVNSNRAAGCSGSEFLELNELEEFANNFKKQRIKHGFTQGDVGVALGKRYGTDFSQTTISRFEALNLSYKNMCKLRPLLKEWLEEAEQMIENGATVVDILEAPSPILLHNSCSSSEANQNEWSETEEKNRSNNINTNSLINPLTTPRLIGNLIIPSLKRRRKRTNLDNAQKASLDVFFKSNSRPDHQRMNEIASILELDPDVVRVWFCNRRQKLRKVC